MAKCAHCTYESTHLDPMIAHRNVTIHMKRRHPEVPSGNDLKRERRAQGPRSSNSPWRNHAFIFSNR